MSTDRCQYLKRIQETFVAWILLLLVALSQAITGCRTDSLRSPIAARAISTPKPPVSAPANCPTRFAEVGREAGLDYRWTVTARRPITILQSVGNGCAFLDYDQDGNLDILLVGPKLALYRGDGTGKFADVTDATELNRLAGHFLGCCVGDIDNDGYPDLYLSGYREGRLLHNVGSGSGSRGFRDITSVAGLKPQPWGTSCIFADLNNDGLLDLFVCNYVVFDETKRQHCEDRGVKMACGPAFYEPIRGILYRNRDGRRFEDVTHAWAINHTGKGLGVACADFDGSGRVSLAIANDMMPGDLLTRDAAGSWKNIGKASGTATDQFGQVHGGMGIDWGDYDNDGWPDLFVATYRKETKCLYHNQGDGLFTEVSEKVGIEEPAWPLVAFGCKFADFDNDGWLDLLIANGHISDTIDLLREETYRQPLQFFYNAGGQPVRFQHESERAGLAHLAPIVGRGLAIGDYDSDGCVDALVVDSEGRPLLLHNETPARDPKLRAVPFTARTISPQSPTSGGAHWLGFRLEGRGKINRDGYGAALTVETDDGRSLRRWCQSGGSYLSASDPRVHFGLGSARPVRLTARWPDGRVDTWRDLPVNAYMRLRPGQPPLLDSSYRAGRPR